MAGIALTRVMDPAQLVRPCSATLSLPSTLILYWLCPRSSITLPDLSQVSPPRHLTSSVLRLRGGRFHQNLGGREISWFLDVTFPLLQSVKVGPPGHIKGVNSVLESLNDLLLDEVRLSVQLPATLEAAQVTAVFSDFRQCPGLGKAWRSTILLGSLFFSSSLLRLGSDQWTEGPESSSGEKGGLRPC